MKDKMIPFPNKKYKIIYADPPWQYSSGECISRKSHINKTDHSHYKPMNLSDIKSLPIYKISDDDCLLFLWVVSPMLDDGIDLLKSWGFKYSTIGFVWEKELVNPGHYTMSSCEVCIIGKKGKIPIDDRDRTVRQFLQEKRSKHSKKPYEISNRIERMFPSVPRIELFARDAKEGWDCWGNEVETKGEE